VWAPATYRTRWLRATTDIDARIKLNGRVTDLTNATSVSVTYRENGAFLWIHLREGGVRKLDWRNQNALDELLRTGRLDPQVERFEFRKALQGPSIALALAFGAATIFICIVWLPSAAPILLRLPWILLLTMTGVVASLVPVRLLYATVIVDGPRLCLRSGLKRRTLSSEQVQSIAATDQGVAIQVRGEPLIEIVTTSQNTAKRLVRAWATCCTSASR
ncbi:MAG: hypothetical protein M3O46_09700, partial [Myxococcota bacterium]|nr:hypothetical protein [Myxococcota bacterium]